MLPFTKSTTFPSHSQSISSRYIKKHSSTRAMALQVLTPWLQVHTRTRLTKVFSCLPSMRFVVVEYANSRPLAARFWTWQSPLGTWTCSTFSTGANIPVFRVLPFHLAIASVNFAMLHHLRHMSWPANVQLAAKYDIRGNVLEQPCPLGDLVCLGQSECFVREHGRWMNRFAYGGQWDSVSHGPSWNQSNHKDIGPGCRKGQLDLVQWLTNRDETIHASFIAGVFHGHLHIVQWLLENLSPVVSTLYPVGITIVLTQAKGDIQQYIEGNVVFDSVTFELNTSCTESSSGRLTLF
ncbi:Aste57867_7929 [Aphanomyces stellatus]|uniref:Aste57867_7929 protein n=1 Tax=Aphanomyces stellatus TaxID=120398 RepID=A0A485KJ16_9STRA|nr:hypothetical protein As57867_007899 [Aphanomyces stellatus]VFT84822.1 Aste57867_7929 [Aphanomyces stellatus]